MTIRYRRQFLKQAALLPRSVQTKLQSRLGIFALNQVDPVLRNHRLKGKHRLYRSIDVTGDIRALYQEFDGGVIEFGVIGTHSQLYR